MTEYLECKLEVFLSQQHAEEHRLHEVSTGWNFADMIGLSSKNGLGCPSNARTCSKSLNAYMEPGSVASHYDFKGYRVKTV